MSSPPFCLPLCLHQAVLLQITNYLQKANLRYCCSIVAPESWLQVVIHTGNPKPVAAVLYSFQSLVNCSWVHKLFLAKSRQAAVKSIISGEGRSGVVFLFTCLLRQVGENGTAKLRSTVCFCELLHCLSSRSASCLNWISREGSSTSPIFWLSTALLLLQVVFKRWCCCSFDCGVKANQACWFSWCSSRLSLFGKNCSF